MWLNGLRVWLCLALLTLPVHAADLAFFDKSFGDFAEELNNAREQGKAGVFVFFEMDECPFCYRMKTTILNQPAVIEYFRKNFLTFPLDIEGTVEITDFQGKVTSMKDFAFKQHRVRATPVLAFFDLQGNLVAKYTGATTDANEFLLLGEFVVSGAYKDSNFTRYKRSHRQAPIKASGG
jgi:thioredoxin-related protein